MALAALATTDDLTRFGYPVPANADNLLDRASVRIRLAAGRQTITSDTSTVTFPPPADGVLRLWQFPVTAIHAVSLDDGTQVTDYELVGNDLYLPTTLYQWVGYDPMGFTDAWRYSNITVTYSHGFDTVPDELVELTCSVAMRMSGTKPDRDPAIQAQTVGDVSQTINPAALDLASRLLPGEESTIRRIFYRRG
jgi:hypothetical protein